MYQTVSIKLFETKFCGVIGVALSYTVFIALMVGAFVYCRLTPDILIQKQDSVWDCPNDSIPSFDSFRCHGVDLSSLEEGNVAISESVNANSAYMYTHLLLIPIPIQPAIGVSIEIDLLLNITNDSNNKTDEKLTNTISLHCALDSPQCDPIVALVREAGHFNASFRFSASNDSDLARAFTQAIGDVLTVWEYANPHFSEFSEGFRVVHILVTVVFLAVYSVNMCRIKEVKTVEQKWLIAFLLFCIAYDNPLVPFQMRFPSFALSALDLIFSSAFIAFAMFYVLLVLGAFINKRTSLKYFVLPRLAFSCLVFGVNLAYELVQLSLPSIAGIRSRTFVVEALRWVHFVVDVLFLLWYAYTLIRLVVISRLHPIAVEGRYRAYVLFVVLVFTLYIALVVLTQFVLISRKDIERLFLLSRTCMNAFGCILTLWLMPTHIERVTPGTLSHALRPRAKSGYIIIN